MLCMPNDTMLQTPFISKIINVYANKCESYNYKFEKNLSSKNYRWEVLTKK